jgi:hypothetical protein
LQGSLTDDAPTLSQITAIVGRTATSAGRGYQVTIFDTDGSKKAYHIVSDGANWHYTVMTKAL